MKNFVSVIFDNNEINETQIVESMKSSAGMALTESETIYGLFETVDNRTVIQLRLSRELSESESDIFANKLANKLFDQGYDDFDIDVSVNESFKLYEQTGRLNLNDFKQQIEAAGPYTVNAAGTQVTMRDGSGTVAGVNENGNLWSGSDIISQIVRRGVPDNNRPTGPGAGARPGTQPVTNGALAQFAQSGEGGIANNPEARDAIRELQQRLISLGYNLGTTGADGIYGPRTRAAVRAYQEANELTVDGDAGPETIGRLLGGQNQPTPPEEEPTTPPEEEPTTPPEEEPTTPPEEEPTTPPEEEPTTPPEEEPTTPPEEEPTTPPEEEPTTPPEEELTTPTDADLASFRNALGSLAGDINPDNVSSVQNEIEQLGSLSNTGSATIIRELTNTYSVDELVEGIQEARSNNAEIEGAFDLLNLYKNLGIDVPVLEFEAEPMLLRDNFNVGDTVIIGGREATVAEVGGEKYFDFGEDAQPATPPEQEEETSTSGTDSVVLQDGTEDTVSWTITKNQDSLTGSLRGPQNFDFTAVQRDGQIILDTEEFGEILVEPDFLPELYSAIQQALNESKSFSNNPLLETFLTDEETYDGNDFFEAYGVMWFNEDEELDEAEYQGRKVKLGKPMRGDVKKFKVYVRNPKGNVVKVNFGDPDMRIKKSNPARRRSFRARHNCDNPGPRHKARYWSCRKW